MSNDGQVRFVTYGRFHGSFSCIVAFIDLWLIACRGLFACLPLGGQLVDPRWIVDMIALHMIGLRFA